jgi:hypothetical protein
MLHVDEYTRLRAQYDAYETARETFNPTRFKRGGEYSPEDIAAICKLANVERAITNEERSALEIFDFVRNVPECYFLYVDEKTSKATTWTGESLGTIVFGHEYKSPAFNAWSVRVPVRIRAINGRTYSGTYYKSAGSYARVRLCKDKRAT